MKVLLVFSVLALLLGLHFYDKYTKVIDGEMCEYNHSDHVREYSDELVLLSSGAHLVGGVRHTYKIDEWMVVLEGDSFLCFSNLGNDNLTDLTIPPDENRLPNIGVEGVAYSGDIVNFSNVGWKKVSLDQTKNVQCLQITHSEKLFKGARFIELSIDSPIDLNVGEIYWLSEGYWSTKCKE